MTRRRILVRGLTPEAVVERVRRFDGLYPRESVEHVLTVSQPVGGWVEIDAPVDLALAELLNLAKWMEGDAAAPGGDDVIAVSHGDGPDAFWLVPAEAGGPDWYLSGAAGGGTPFQWDCVARRAVDDPRVRRAPMGTRLALMSRHVPAALHGATGTRACHATVPLHFGERRVEGLVLPEPGRLSDTFRRTVEVRPGGFEQVLNWLGLRKG